MKYIVTSIIVLLLLGAVVYWQWSPSPLSVNGKLRIVTEGVYPPFNMHNAEGELIGFDIDIANAICDRLNVGCTIVAHDWEDIIIGLMTNKYDAIINGMSITDNRKQWLAFSQPYYSNRLAFVARKNTEFTNIESLRSKLIGVQRSTVSAHYLEGMDNFSVVRVMRYDSQNEAWEALLNSQVDAVLSDQLIGYYWVKEHAEYDFVGNPVEIGDKVGIAFRKKDVELRKQVNRALDAILKDGTYAKINQKYFPFNIYE